MQSAYESAVIGQARLELAHRLSQLEARRAPLRVRSWLPELPVCLAMLCGVAALGLSLAQLGGVL